VEGKGSLMTAWVHKDCDIMDQDALLRLQGAWDSPKQKDKCAVCMNNFELDYWMGTEVGQLGGSASHCGVEVTESSTNKQHTLSLWVSRSNF